MGAERHAACSNRGIAGTAAARMGSINLLRDGLGYSAVKDFRHPRAERERRELRVAARPGGRYVAVHLAQPDFSLRRSSGMRGYRASGCRRAYRARRRRRRTRDAAGSAMVEPGRETRRVHGTPVRVARQEVGDAAGLRERAARPLARSVTDAGLQPHAVQLFEADAAGTAIGHVFVYQDPAGLFALFEDDLVADDRFSSRSAVDPCDELTGPACIEANLRPCGPGTTPGSTRGTNHRRAVHHHRRSS